MFVPPHIIVNLYERWDELEPPKLDCDIVHPFPSPPAEPLRNPYSAARIHQPAQVKSCPLLRRHDFNGIADRVGIENCARAIQILLLGAKSKSDGAGFIYIFKEQRVTRGGCGEV